MGIERFQLAYEYLEPLVQADSSRGMKMRQAECLLRLNRPADARKVFDASIGTGERELGEELLDGAISVAIGDELRLKSDTNGARAAFEAALAPYQRAKQLAPAIPQPFIQDAMLKRKLFELTGDRTRGQEALAAADRATVLPTLRAIAILLARGVEIAPPELARLHALLDALDGHPAAEVRREVVELLVAARHPDALSRVLVRLDAAASQEEEIHCVHTLCRHPGPWTTPAHRRLLAWFAGARALRGGNLLPQIVARMQADILATIPPDARGELAADIARLTDPAPGTPLPRRPPRPFVKRWALDDLAGQLDPGSLGGRDRDAGLRALAAGECLACHRFGDSGSSIGPDLSAVGRRFDARAILESVLEPSRVVDPKYHATTWVTADGRAVTGRAAMVNDREIAVETDVLTGARVTLARAEIESSHPSTVSPMPQGLLDTLSRDEVLDLLALLGAGAR